MSGTRALSASRLTPVGLRAAIGRSMRSGSQGPTVRRELAPQAFGERHTSVPLPCLLSTRFGYRRIQHRQTRVRA